MSRITKKEWEIINQALREWYLEHFENDQNQFEIAFPGWHLDNDEHYDKANEIFQKLEKKVWDKIDD